MRRELEKINASTAKWAKGEKHFVRRFLDAERVARELEGVMSNIHAANERFLVWSPGALVRIIY
jgi:PAB1-binding protein PBP1